MAANITLTYSPAAEPLSFKILKITLYSLILIFSLIGNSMVMFMICRSKRLKIPSNLLIFNLAICDLITPITSIPFDLALEENRYKWPFGRALCRMLWPLATFSSTSASLILALISFDRYRVIMHPFQPRLTSRQLKISLGVLHFFSAVLVTPYIYHLELVEETGSCKENWPRFSYRKAYTLVLFFVQYALSLVFMVIMYAITLKNLRSSSSKFEDFVYRSRTNNIRTMASENKSKERGYVRIPCDKIDSRKQNIRATKMFIIVVAVFAICMLPNQFYWLWSDFGAGLESELNNTVGIICRMFTYMNGVFNPVIYSIFSKDFKNVCRRIFRAVSEKVRRRCLWISKIQRNKNGRTHSATARSWGDVEIRVFGRRKPRTTTVQSYNDSAYKQPPTLTLTKRCDCNELTVASFENVQDLPHKGIALHDNNNNNNSNNDIDNNNNISNSDGDNNNNISNSDGDNTNNISNSDDDNNIGNSDGNSNSNSNNIQTLGCNVFVKLQSQIKNKSSYEESDQVCEQSSVSHFDCDWHSHSINMMSFPKNSAHKCETNGLEILPLDSLESSGNKTLGARTEWCTNIESWMILFDHDHFLPSSTRSKDEGDVNDRQIPAAGKSGDEKYLLQRMNSPNHILNSGDMKETDC